MIFKNVEKKENNTAWFEVEADAAEFEAAINGAYLKNRGSIYIPGFRKGKAPRSIVEGMYGKEVFYQDAMDELAPKAFDQGLSESGLRIVGAPSIQDVKVTDDHTVVYTFAVSLYPEVTLGQYKGLEAVKNAAPVSDEDVDEIYNVRVLLDMQVYERIVSQRLMTDAHYDYLNRCIDKYAEMRSVFEKSVEEGQLEFFDLECRFHFYIHNISGLKWTTELLKKTYSRLFQYMIHNVGPEDLPRIYTFHHKIVENLRAGNLAALAENRIEAYMEGKAYRPDK